MLPRAVKRFFCRLAPVVALVWGGMVSGTAAPNYSTRVWQVEQGLPQNKVSAVLQTRDGYLWVGTYRGLARFDGIHFTVFDDNNTPQLHSSRITSLFEAADGTLWIATESGDISQFKDGRFVSFAFHADWNRGKIYAITADDAGDIWFMNEAGQLARAKDGMVLSPPSGIVAKVISLARGVDGTVWINREGIVSALKGGRLTTQLSTNDYVQGLCASRDGGFWVAGNGGIRKWKDGGWVSNLGAAPWGWNIVVDFMETSDGVLAGGMAGTGLWLVFPGKTNSSSLLFDRAGGLPSNWTISLWEDREKNLWCGTGAGLVVIRPNNFETISPPDKWKGCPVLAVQPSPDGTLWVGTEGAGLYRFKTGVWTNFDVNNGIRNSYIWSLAADRSGKIWAGTWGGGLFVQNDDSFQFPSGLENFLTPIPARLFSGDDLWIGTTAGVLRYKDGIQEKFAEADGEPFGDVRYIVKDKTGAFWFGTAGQGLVCWRNGTFRRFKKDDGLSSDFIECLHFTRDGALWIGTFGGGLNRLKNGRFSVINQQQGLPNNVIGHIEEDDLGYFWISSYGGIIRAAKSDLNRCADGEIAQVPFLSYGVNDGLPTLECSEGLQSAGCKTADGRLWFATAKGLVAVDPARVRINPLPPQVRIEEMRVDDKKFAEGNAAGPLKISPGRHRIQFEYTGLSFVAPEKVRFKCRLNNFEPDWADVGEKRVITYNYIPPGSYSFQVMACNNDGVWNETAAQLEFNVLPYFWQTAWFRFLAGLAVVMAASGMVWFETRRRMRRKLERAERQRDLERERSRIARDIHDDLGAQLTRITMLSESASEPEADPHRSAESVRRIYETARELTRSMDEIVWAVSPRHDTLESLVTYLEKFAQDWLAGAGIRCRLDLPLQFPEWHLTSEVRHNVFLAFKEALHNTVKHSAATEVLIRLKLEEKSFELSIEDNGRGFAPGQTDENRSGSRDRTASGNGMENMRRRLAAVGGSCEIQSALGAGTKILFSVQLKASVLRNPGH